MKCTKDFSDVRLQQVVEETGKDQSLQDLFELITSTDQFPERRSQVAPGARPCFDFLDELSYVDGILVKGERMIIPQTM